MRLFLIIAILLWASVTKTVSPQTLSTISGPSQGSLPTSTLPEDCLSTVDWHDIVFISAVPIAAGFGLLLLLASLQDLRQAYKSKRSCPPSPSNNQGNRARKERTYVIDVDFAGRSRWGSLLRWCALHKSSGARKHKRLVRLQGTIGFSDWLSFDLILGENQEQKTLTTPRSIGKLVAVEMEYPSASDGLNSRLVHVPSSNIGACVRGFIQRACDIEIKKIHATDTKTQDQYISGCGPSSGGLSSSDQGITTILPLLPWTSPPASRVNYAAYYFKDGSLWTSTFIPWHQGNFTGSRHITCLFACISYTMRVAVQVMSELSLDPSMEDIILVSWTDFNITAAMLIRAIVVGVVVFLLVGVMETVFRSAPTIWSLHLLCVSPRTQNGYGFTDNLQPTHVQSASGDFYGGSRDGLEEGLPRMSISAPDMQQQGSEQSGNANQQTYDTSSECNKISKTRAASSNTHTQINNHDDREMIKNVTTNVQHAGSTGYSQWTVVNKLATKNKSLSEGCVGSNLDVKDTTSLTDVVQAKHSCNDTRNSRSDIQPALTTSNDTALAVSGDICGDNQSICAANMLECHHKFTCYKCPVCKRTTGSRYYDPGAGCSGETTSVRYSLYDYGGWILPRCASSSSSLNSKDGSSDSLTVISTMDSHFRSSSGNASGWSNLSELTSITNSASCISEQLLDETAPYKTKGGIGTKAFEDNMETQQTASPLPPSMEPSRAMSGLPDNQHKSIGEQAGDGLQVARYHHEACKGKQEDTTAPEEFKAYSAALVEANIKSAKVLRTKNYINRFSDMGKGIVVVLPYGAAESFDPFLPQDKLVAIQPINYKSNLSASGTVPKHKINRISKTPTDDGPVKAGSDCIINLPMEFEMPRVTIQSSSSHKSFFFNVKKWLAGLRAKPKVDVGDDYKLEVTENDAAIKTSDENTGLFSIQHGTADTAAIQIEEIAKFYNILSCPSPGQANKNLPDIPNAEDDKTKMYQTDDHLKRSIFQSSSRLIEYQPDVISVASSSGSWSSTFSPRDTASKQITPWVNANATNENNNSNEATVINMDPSSSHMPCSTSSEEYLSVESGKTSSGSSSVVPKSTSSEGFYSSKDISSNNDICSGKDSCSSKDTDGRKDISSSKDTYCAENIVSSKDICSSDYTGSNNTCNSNTSSSTDHSMVTKEKDPHQYRYKYYQSLYNAQSTIMPSEHHSSIIQLIEFLICYILLIASCVLAVLWSVSSVHGLCWNVFWEWVATSIIAVLIQAVILDMIKAAVMTFVMWYYHYHKAKPKPYSVIE